MAVTRTWKVWGLKGYRQRESFGESVRYDWTNDRLGTRIVEIDREDKTGTNDYVIVRITRDNAHDCCAEFDGLLSDGIFKNSAVGKIEEI